MQLQQIPLEQVHPDPEQPRKQFADAQIQSLATSILTLGQLHPIRVTTNDDGYMIEDGERRWRAMQLLEWSMCDAIVVEPGESEEETRLKQIVANNWHQHLTVTELADTVHRLVHKEFASDNDIISHFDSLGLKITKKTIKTYHAIAGLPDPIRSAIDKGLVEADDITRIAKLPWDDLPKDLFTAGMEHVRQRAKWGRLTAHDCVYAVGKAARDQFIDLTRTQEWAREERVYFDQARACRGCPHKLTWDDYRLCMKAECFEEKNLAAQEAVPKKAKAKNEDEVLAEVQEGNKQLKREDQLKRNIIKHLHRQLAKRLDEYLQDTDDGPHEVCKTIVLWGDAHCPGGGGNHSNEWGRASVTQAKDIRELLLGVNAHATWISAARERLSKMSWDNIRAVALHCLGTKLVDVWSPDEDYIKIWRKAELAEWAHSLGCHQPPGEKGWGNYKLAELVDHISSSQLDHFAAHEPARYLYEEADFDFFDNSAWRYNDDDLEDDDETDKESS